jgi:hypothetical protein
VPIFSPDQETDPIEQLLYSCFHARRSLDRIDKAIWAQFPQPRDPTPAERNQIRNKRATPEELRLLDLLYATPYGKSLADTQHQLRNQLANIAKQYVSLEGGQSTLDQEEVIREVAPFTQRDTPSGTGLTEAQRKKLAS